MNGETLAGAARGAALTRPGLLAVLAGLSAFGPLTTDVYLPGLPDLAETLGGGAAGAQLTLTACVIGLALGQLLAGAASDMMGRQQPLLAGLGAFIVASLACAAASSAPVLIAARFVQGVTGGAGIVIARAMVRDLSAGVESARAYSTLNAIVTAAPIFAPLLGGCLLLFTDWRGIFLALAVVGIALLAAALAIIGETLPAERRQTHALAHTLRNVGLLMTQRDYMAFALSGALGFAAFFSYIAASSFVYQDVFGMSAQLYAVLFAVNGLALMASNVANRRLVGRIPPRRLLRRGLLVLAGASLAIMVAVIAGDGGAIVLPLLLVTAGSGGFVISNSIALAMEHQESRAGAASALFGLLQFGLGAVIAPLVSVAGSSAIPMGVAMAVCALAALGTCLVLARRVPEPH